jgi:hypothetical protein
MNKYVESGFEWSSTVILLAGVVLTSFNVYPANIWFLLIGNIGWIALGWIWRKWSLIILQTIITVIYIAGIIKVYVGQAGP